MGWLDIIGIGIDAAQLHQLSKVRGTLRDAEASRLSEIERAELVEALRNVVFGSLKSLETLEKRLENSPQPVFVVGNLLQHRLNFLGISPEIFPEFADKEYVQKAFARMDALLKGASSRLESGMRSEAQECVKAIEEMSLLDQAIAADSLRGELDNLRAEFGEISKQKSRSSLFAWSFLLGGPALACVGCGGLFMFFGGSTQGSFGGSIFQIGLVLTILVAVAGVVLGAVLLGGKTQSKYSESKRNIKAFEEQLPDEGTQAAIHQSFGSQSQEQLKQIKQEREALIRRVMGQIEDYDRLLLTSAL